MIEVDRYWYGNFNKEVEKSTIFVNGLFLEIRSMVARFCREQARNILKFDLTLSYLTDETDSYRALMSTRSQTIWPGTSTNTPSTRPKTLKMATGSSFHKNNRILTFLEPPLTKSQEGYSLYHLHKEILEAYYDLYQREEGGKSIWRPP